MLATKITSDDQSVSCSFSPLPTRFFAFKITNRKQNDDGEKNEQVVKPCRTNIIEGKIEENNPDKENQPALPGGGRPTPTVGFTFEPKIGS